jgi:hypothetical protein
MVLTGAGAAKANRETENKARLAQRYQTTGLSVLYAPGILFAHDRICCHHERSYAVTDLAEHFASGRAEDPSLFHKKFARGADFL